MLQRISTALAIVLLTSSFAFTGQGTDPAVPRASKPATTAGASQSPTKAPVKKHKKRRKGHKKQAKQTTTSTQPKR